MNPTWRRPHTVNVPAVSVAPRAVVVAAATTAPPPPPAPPPPLTSKQGVGQEEVSLIRTAIQKAMQKAGISSSGSAVAQVVKPSGGSPHNVAQSVTSMPPVSSVSVATSVAPLVNAAPPVRGPAASPISAVKSQVQNVLQSVVPAVNAVFPSYVAPGIAPNAAVKTQVQQVMRRVGVVPRVNAGPPVPAFVPRTIPNVAVNAMPPVYVAQGMAANAALKSEIQQVLWSDGIVPAVNAMRPVYDARAMVKSEVQQVMRSAGIAPRNNGVPQVHVAPGMAANVALKSAVQQAMRSAGIAPRNNGVPPVHVARGMAANAALKSEVQHGMRSAGIVPQYVTPGVHIPGLKTLDKDVQHALGAPTGPGRGEKRKGVREGRRGRRIQRSRRPKRLLRETDTLSRDAKMLEATEMGSSLTRSVPMPNGLYSSPINSAPPNRGVAQTTVAAAVTKAGGTTVAAGAAVRSSHTAAYRPSAYNQGRRGTISANANVQGAKGGTMPWALLLPTSATVREGDHTPHLPPKVKHLAKRLVKWDIAAQTESRHSVESRVKAMVRWDVRMALARQRKGQAGAVRSRWRGPARQGQRPWQRQTQAGRWERGRNTHQQQYGRHSPQLAASRRHGQAVAAMARKAATLSKMAEEQAGTDVPRTPSVEMSAQEQLLSSGVVDTPQSINAATPVDDLLSTAEQIARQPQIFDQQHDNSLSVVAPTGDVAEADWYIDHDQQKRISP